METIKSKLISEPFYTIAISLCGLMFFLKGVDYLLLGSVIPFVMGTFILIGFYYSIVKNTKLSRRLLKILSVMLILWGCTRLAVELMFMFASVTEAHIRAQFNLPNRVLSLAAIVLGFYFVRKGKKASTVTEA